MNDRTKSGPSAHTQNSVDIARFADIDAERAVLGILLKNNSSYEQIHSILRGKNAFASLQNGLIYGAIESVYQRGGTADVITVSDLLLAHGFESGIKKLIGSMAQNSPPFERAGEYAAIIANHAAIRLIYESLVSTIDKIVTPKSTPASALSLLDPLDAKISSLREALGGTDRTTYTLSEAISQTLDDIKSAESSERTIVGVETGIKEFDELTTGLHGGDFVIIAARPSMGKTALAMNIAEHVAFKEKNLVLIYSLEMSAKSLGARMLSSHASVDLRSLRTGRLHDGEETARFNSAVSYLSGDSGGDNIIIDEGAALNIVDMRARSRRLTKKRKIGLIIVDYLQLVAAFGSSENDRTTEISRGLKAMAKENNCPVIALSQLNRALELRNDKRPIMSDLRGSGSLEQDADIIAFIYRDEVYNAKTSMRGLAEIILAKQRNGPIGDVIVGFEGKHTRFHNIAA